MSITWNSKIHFKPNYKQDHKIFSGGGNFVIAFKHFKGIDNFLDIRTKPVMDILL